jgi:hypothetical protein
MLTGTSAAFCSLVSAFASSVVLFFGARFLIWSSKPPPAFPFTAFALIAAWRGACFLIWSRKLIESEKRRFVDLRVRKGSKMERGSLKRRAEETAIVLKKQRAEGYEEGAIIVSVSSLCTALHALTAADLLSAIHCESHARSCIAFGALRKKIR